MSKFNTKTKESNVITNHEGAEAYSLSAPLELYSLVCNSFIEDKFYESKGNQLNRITELVKQCDPVFVSNLASYARNEMNLRSAPVVLAVLLAWTHGGSVARKTFSRVIKRADEITEAFSYFFSINKHGDKVKAARYVPNSLIRGIKDVFESGRFGEYNYAKYNRDTEVKLRDAMFLSHPKPVNDEMKALFDKLKDDKLETPYTWEVELASVGHGVTDPAEKTRLKKQKWEELVDSGKLGYMALIRNLRNMLEVGISKDHLEKVTTRLSNKDEVLKSKQFPFRFYSAYKEISTMYPVDEFDKKAVLDALESAIGASIANYPTFNGRTAIATDLSGSMHSSLSPKSSIQYFEVGCVLSMAFYKHYGNTIIGGFGHKFEMFNKASDYSILNGASALSRLSVGHSTNGYLFIDHLLKTKTVAENVFIFTDMQLWNYGGWMSDGSLKKSWARYKKEVAPNSTLWVFDLAGYGRACINVERKNDVVLLAGWSDKIFEAVSRVREGDSAISIINSYDK